MIKIQSNYSNLFNTKTSNNKIRYKEKGKILVKINAEKINSNGGTTENKHINKLTDAVNKLVSRVMDLKKQKEQYDKKIRRAINILECRGAKSVSEVGKENDSNTNTIIGNNTENSLQANAMENKTQENTVQNNDSKANSDEINNRETNSTEIINNETNLKDGKNKNDEKLEDKDVINPTEKNADKNVSKESSDYAATQIKFDEKDMDNKDDKVEKSFVGKTLDELKDMLKEYDSKSQSEIDKLQDSIKTIKEQILKLKVNKNSNKNKHINKNNKKSNGLDLLV